jgi:ASC-1-like (ASCH) protein
MITCANCDSSYGSSHDFGFLKLSEIIGADSYHFTTKKSYLEAFQRNHVKVDKELLYEKYYSVKCISCREVVGRKVVVSEKTFYIVFEKEKLVYDSFHVQKIDTWASLLRQSPFDKLDVFEVKEFEDVKSTKQQNNMQPGNTSHPHAAQQPNSRAASLLNRPIIKKNDRNQNNSSFKRGNDHNQSNSAKSERPKVRDSVTEVVQFLKLKKEMWKVDQIILEFSGANKTNWKTATDVGIAKDNNGKVLDEIFNLLSLQEVRDSPNASVLYTPFSEPLGLMGIMTYLTVGSLKEESLLQAVSRGRGGKQWLEVMDIALCAVQTIRYVMEKFACVRSHSCMSMIMEVLPNRINTLIGNNFDETDTSDGWALCLSDSDKCKSVSVAKKLSSIVSAMRRMQKASIDVRIEKSNERDEEEKERERERAVARVRHRGGVCFLDDPLRDNDYLIVSVTPTPADLLSPPPKSLPENHVEKGSSTESGQFDSKQLTIAPQNPYRDHNHYLNTHFALGREDCVAQLRRGLKAFREILMEDPDSPMIVPPLPEKLKKACHSFCRTRDSGAYIYGDVRVDNVDGLRDGIGYVVSFNMYESRKVDWTSTSRFMNGSLLCLSKDGTFNPESIVVATVLRGVQTPKGNCNYALLALE